ncbi:hypothetical protein HDU76_011814, partial [Blyttiomyces sp. JEL0837]
EMGVRLLELVSLNATLRLRIQHLETENQQLRQSPPTSIATTQTDECPIKVIKSTVTRSTSPIRFSPPATSPKPATITRSTSPAPSPKPAAVTSTISPATSPPKPAVFHRRQRHHEPAKYIENVYVKIAGLHRVDRKEWYGAVRSSLTAAGIESGVLDMSFVGRSVVHLLVEESACMGVKEFFRGRGFLMPDGFNPLLPSGHANSTVDMGVLEKACVYRLARLYGRSRDRVKWDAVVRGFSESICMRVRSLVDSLYGSTL